MLYNTRGIVLHSLRYAETSIIARVFTERFGMQTYLVKGVHSPRSKFRPALFQSLMMLDLVVYHREKQSLQALKEARVAFPYQEIPFDIRKSSVAIFIDEVAYRSIREEEANPFLFAFLWETCLRLDGASAGIASFPLRFTVQLMPFLGIAPRNNFSDLAPVFDMREGLFQAGVPNHPQYLAGEMAGMLAELLEDCQSNDRVDGEIYTGSAARGRMLDVILLYYGLHLAGFRGVESHHILHDVLA